ncbi:MAG: hypothetical protein ACI4PO_10790 [Faecousia sp.]
MEKPLLDQFRQAYCESHKSDPPEISNGFKGLETFPESLPLDDNNAVINLCCSLAPPTSATPSGTVCFTAHT